MRTPRWVAALVLAVALAGCSSGSSGSDAGGAADSAASAAPEGGDGQAAVGEAAPAPAIPADGRQVVTTGEVAVTVGDPRAAADAVTADVEARGGRVDDRSEQAGRDDREGGGATASLVVRVPSDQVTATVAALRDLGDVTSVSIASDDVTGAARDLDARTQALRTSVARLEALIADATTTADLITAEQALTDRQSALEQLVAERSRLAEQVSLSTLSVSLTTTAGPSAVERTGFTGGLAAGWSGLRSAAGALAVVAGALLPWAVVLGALAAAVVALRRRLRGRRARTSP